MAIFLLCIIFLVSASHYNWAEQQRNDRMTWLKWGDSLTIQCSTTKDNYDGLYLLWGLDEKTEVFFLFKEDKKLTLGMKYSSRVKTEGEVNKLTITIANMTEDDSGVYWCKYRYLNEETGNTDRAKGNGSRLVVVRGAYKPCPDGDGTPAMTPTLVTVTAISAGSVFLLCVVIIFIWVVPRVKKSSAKKRRVQPRRNDSVYEDMRRTQNSY
ncbi:uncharacterized protein LOC118776245 [Megalops cyprinoides]|uniref:uncharacterized protein LOC118776245 n=1 Tax=Megalops cyprinoides TaxID=118141 RepID=UPI0018650358|nr:uncharacterized protein LOC118776245 [Megalops cyprinoides]